MSATSSRLVFARLRGLCSGRATHNAAQVSPWMPVTTLIGSQGMPLFVFQTVVSLGITMGTGSTLVPLLQTRICSCHRRGRD